MNKSYEGLWCLESFLPVPSLEIRLVAPPIRRANVLNVAQKQVKGYDMLSVFTLVDVCFGPFFVEPLAPLPPPPLPPPPPIHIRSRRLNRRRSVLTSAAQCNDCGLQVVFCSRTQQPRRSCCGGGGAADTVNFAIVVS